MEEKNQKRLLVLKIIAFKLGKVSSHNPEQYICPWESMCYEKPLIVKRSLREIFSKSGSPRVMEKVDESALMPVLQEFGTF